MSVDRRDEEDVGISGNGGCQQRLRYVGVFWARFEEG